MKEYLKSLKEKIKFISNNDFYHATSITNIGKILFGNAITSANLRNKKGFGNNGSHFISVSQLSSNLYRNNFKTQEGFIIDESIFAIKTEEKGIVKNATFTNTRYPLRLNGLEEEWQVLDKIDLKDAKAICINPKIISNLARILYIQEKIENHLPLLTNEGYYKIDPNELKRLIKIK